MTATELERPLPQAAPPTACGIAAPRERAPTVTVRQGLLSLIDQGAVSGTNFVVGVLIGRVCGADELGLYSLGFSLALLLVCVQDALISLPYTIDHRRRDATSRAELAGSTLMHCGLLSLLAITGLAVAGAVVWSSAVLPPFAMVIWVLAATAPGLLLREFYRRLEFAHLRPSRALALDLVASILQLAGTGALAMGAGLSAAAAIAARGLASAAAGAVGVALGRRHIRVVRQRVAGDWAIQRALGKWILAGQIAGVAQAYALYWLLAWRMGAAATGAFAACSTLVLLSNPFMIGVGNVLMPRTARAYTDGGAAELRRVVRKSTLLVGGVMAVFCGLLGLFGDRALTLFYGESYDGQGDTLGVLAMALLVQAVGTGADTGLQASAHPAASFRANLVAVCVMLAVAVCLVGPWRLVGAAYGVFAGNVAGTCWRVQAFLRLTGENCPAVVVVRKAAV